MFHNNHKEKFELFIRKHIRRELKSETVKLNQWIRCFSIKKTNYSFFQKLMEKYEVPYKTFIEDRKNYIPIKDGYIGIKYLEQYEVKDFKKERMYSRLQNELDEIPKDNDFLGGYSVSYSSADEFEEIEIGKGTAYFILDESDMDDARNIVKHLVGFDIDVNYVDVRNEEFEVNGLIYFEIPNNYNLDKKNYPSYDILCLLIKSGINHCIYYDRDGELRLELRIKEKIDNRISKVKFRNDLKVVFNSSWEANFARILNYLKIDWEYEKEGFAFDTVNYKGNYLPDFFLPNKTIIEIKGFWDNESIKKVSEFKDTYKDYKLLTLDGDMFHTLEKIYRDNIPEWEEMNVVTRKEIIPVVGINIGSRKKHSKSIKLNEEVFLERDPSNSYDSNAIKVLDNGHNQIGFVAKGWASIYADKLDIGMTYQAKVVNKEEKVIKLSLKRTNQDKDIVYDILI